MRSRTLYDFRDSLARIDLVLKRKLFAILAASVGRELEKKRVAEKTVLRDFESWRARRVDCVRRKS